MYQTKGDTLAPQPVICDLTVGEETITILSLNTIVKCSHHTSVPSFLLPQDGNAGGPPEAAARVPSRCGAPAPLHPTGSHHGPNAHSHAHAEFAAHTAAGVQGTVAGIHLVAFGSPQSMWPVFSLTSCVSAPPSGAVPAAAAHPPAPQRHGASGPKSLRRRSQHPATCPAAQEAPGPVSARGQPGQHLQKCTVHLLLSTHQPY